MTITRSTRAIMQLSRIVFGLAAAASFAIVPVVR